MKAVPAVWLTSFATIVLIGYAIYAAAKIQRLESRLRAVEARTQTWDEQSRLRGESFVWNQKWQDMPLLDAPGPGYHTKLSN
jgi:hypothetical protein